jgi:hypothetical protein
MGIRLHYRTKRGTDKMTSRDRKARIKYFRELEKWLRSQGNDSGANIAAKTIKELQNENTK